MPTRIEVERALERVRRQGIDAASLSDVSLLEFALDDRLPWLTPGLASRIANAVNRPAPVVAPIGVGEALLLVCDSATRRGRALRLRVVAHASGHACFGDRAQGQIRQAKRALLAAIDQGGRSWPTDVRHAEGALVEGITEYERVDEESLGLSVVVAELSRATGIAASATVAGSAVVDARGQLHAVGFLREKIDALRDGWPAVATLVVAETQELVELPLGFTVIRAKTLVEAIGHFGLSLEALPVSSIEHAERVASELDRESRRSHSPEEWSALADEATSASVALAADGSRERALQVRAWAALFRVHAGRSNEVDAAEVDEDAAAYDPRVLAAMAVSRATAAIDAAPSTCVAVATQTLERAEACGDRAIRARALGTLGRALTHTGTPERAEAHFRAAIALWNEVEQPQIPQTQSYLATSLRRAGRVSDAMNEIRDALARCEKRASAYTHETARYAWLELGRCQLELRMFDEAELSLARVLRDDLGDASYPNIGALATRYALREERGDQPGAERDLERCLRVAEGSGPIARVALQAVGRHMLGSEGSERARQCWARHVASADRATIERALREWVY
jgi:tetratricopeptide (TPR) repeat protein